MILNMCKTYNFKLIQLLLLPAPLFIYENKIRMTEIKSIKMKMVYYIFFTKKSC